MDHNEMSEDEFCELIYNIQANEIRNVEVTPSKIQLNFIMKALIKNTSVTRVNFRNTGIDMSQIEECFRQNTSLEEFLCPLAANSAEHTLLVWYLTCNRICKELGARIQHRNSIPKNMTKEDQIRSFVKELKSQESEWRAMKLVTLGHGRIGKTTLLNRFRTILYPNEKVEDLNDTKSTIGIDCKTVSLAQGEVSVWDFAGQLEYTNTHQFFLSIEKVVYLLCYDRSEPIEKQRQQIEYWMEYLNSALPLNKFNYDNRKWEILVIGLKSDKVTPQSESQFQSEHLTSWINQFPLLPIFPRLFKVSSVKLEDESVGELLKVIEEECNQLFTKHTTLVPASYRKVLKDLKSLQIQSSPCGQLHLYYSHGLKREDFEVAMKYFHAIGQIVSLKNGLVFPNPNMATKLAAKCVSPEDVRMRLLSENEVQILNIKQIGSLLNISQSSNTSIGDELALMCEMGICYKLRVKDSKTPLYLFPNLCDVNSTFQFPRDLQEVPNILCAGVQFRVPRHDMIFILGFFSSFMVNLLVKLNIYRRDIIRVSQTGLEIQCQGLFQGELIVVLLPGQKCILASFMASNPECDYIISVFRESTQTSYSQYASSEIEILCPTCIKNSAIATQKWGTPLDRIGIFRQNQKLCANCHHLVKLGNSNWNDDTESCKTHDASYHDVFISYRVFSEGVRSPYSTVVRFFPPFPLVNIFLRSQEPEEGFSRLMYERIAVRKNSNGYPVYVFLDKLCLNDGHNWMKGFIKGLLHSKVVVLLVSTKSLHAIRDNATKKQDNVLVEYECALLRSFTDNITVFPVFVGEIESHGVFKKCDFNIDFPDAPHARDKFAQLTVNDLSTKLKPEHKEFLGSVKKTVELIFLQNGYFMEKRGEDSDSIDKFIEKLTVLQQTKVSTAVSAPVNTTQSTSFSSSSGTSSSSPSPISPPQPATRGAANASGNSSGQKFSEVFIAKLPANLQDKVRTVLVKEEIDDEYIKDLEANDWRSMGLNGGAVVIIRKILDEM